LDGLNAALAERDEKIAALESKVDHLQRFAKTNQEDLEFHKTMYTNASNQAYSLANDLNEARAEIKLLKQQLDLGLKQKELFYASASETKDKTIDELQKQLRLLLDQNRATNDEIRARARDYPNVIATNNRLRRELDAKDEEINDYSLMLKKAKKRIETLYGPRMGRLPRMALVEDVNDEESESSTDEDFNPGSSEEDEDDDETEDEDAEQELVRNVAPPLASPAQPVDARVADVSMAENVAQPVADLGALESAMPAQQLSHGDYPGWLICQWCEERNVPCGFAVHGYEVGIAVRSRNGRGPD
jgi:chromosome segregation ATPase